MQELLEPIRIALGPEELGRCLQDDARALYVG
jgi:hypothetical protein